MKDCPGRGKHGIFWFSFIFSYQCSASDHWETASPFYSFFHRTIQTRWHLSAVALRDQPWSNLYKLSCKGCSQLRTCKLVAAENIPNFAAAVRSPLEKNIRIEFAVFQLQAANFPFRAWTGKLARLSIPGSLTLALHQDGLMSISSKTQWGMLILLVKGLVMLVVLRRKPRMVAPK